jgi:hypothetical protein
LQEALLLKVGTCGVLSAQLHISCKYGLLKQSFAEEEVLDDKPEHKAPALIVGQNGVPVKSKGQVWGKRTRKAVN